MIYFCNYFTFSLPLVLLSLVSAKFYNGDDRVPFPKTFVGSNLFGDGKFVKKCFSMDDVALLSARTKFEVQFFVAIKNILNAPFLFRPSCQILQFRQVI